MELKTIFVKPAKGLKVRKPGNMMHLKDEGEKVELTTYWAKRLKAKDVIEVGGVAPKASAPVKEEMFDEPKTIVAKRGSFKSKKEESKHDGGR